MSVGAAIVVVDHRDEQGAVTMSRHATRATMAVLRGLLVIWSAIAACTLAVSAVLAHQGAPEPSTPFLAALLVGAFAVCVILVHHALDVRAVRRGIHRVAHGE